MRLLCLHIADVSGKGRGVFTNTAIPAETVIEIAPVIVMKAADRLLLDQTALHDYIFEWGDQRNECAMALGWIPMYNHDTHSNCEYFMDFEQASMFVKTVRQVEAGEELCVNYNGDTGDERPVWFQV